MSLKFNLSDFFIMGVQVYNRIYTGNLMFDKCMIYGAEDAFVYERNLIYLLKEAGLEVE